MYSYGPPHMAGQKQDDQLKHTFSSYVRIQDVALKTCQRRWTIGRSGERGSGISVLVTRHDDDASLQRSKTPPPNKCPRYDAKQSDEMRSTSPLLLLPGPLWLRVVVLSRVLSMCLMELNSVLMLNWIVWNRTVLTFNCL